MFILIVISFWKQTNRGSMFGRRLHDSGLHAFAPTIVLLDYATTIRCSPQQQSYCRPSTTWRNQPGFSYYFKWNARYIESTVFFLLQSCFLNLSLNVVIGVKGEPVISPATADTPFPAVPSGPSPQQLLRDLQQQLYKLFTSKPNEKVPFLMGTLFSNSAEVIDKFHSRF